MNVKTLLAAVIFLGLASVVYLKQTKKAERGIERVSFRNIDLSSADSIQVKGEHPVVLSKIKDTWNLPTGRSADGSATKRALEALGKVESSTQVASSITPEVLTKWGLDEEQGTSVVVKAGSKALVDVTIGKVTAGRTPLLVDDAIFSVKGIFPGAFSKPVDSWLEKRLFPHSSKNLESMQYLREGKEVYSLHKAGESGKDLVFHEATELPKGFRFDSGVARSVGTTLLGMRVVSFVEGKSESEATGLSDASDRVRFSYVVGDEKESQSETLVFGGSAADKGVYAQLLTRGDTFIISEYTAKALRKSLDDFRDLKLVDLDTTKVAKVVIRNGKSKLSLVKQDQGWTVESSSKKVPAGFEFDPSLVTRRLNRLAGLKAKALVQPSPRRPGFKKARTWVKVFLEDASEITLHLGKKRSVNDTEGYFAKGNIDGLTYLVADHTRNSILGMLSSFEKKPAPPPSPGLGNLDPAALSKLPPEIRRQLMQQIQAQQGRR